MKRLKEELLKRGLNHRIEFFDNGSQYLIIEDTNEKNKAMLKWAKKHKYIIMCKAWDLKGENVLYIAVTTKEDFKKGIERDS